MTLIILGGRENKLSIYDLRLPIFHSTPTPAKLKSFRGCGFFVLWCRESTQGRARGQFHIFGAVAGKHVRRFFGVPADEEDGEPKVGKAAPGLAFVVTQEAVKKVW